MKVFIIFNVSILFLILTSSVSKLHAQYGFNSLKEIKGQWEIGVTLGASAFFGDLGGTKGMGETFIKDFNTKVTRPLGGVSAGYFVDSWLALKVAADMTSVNGADSLIKNAGGYERWRYYRNLSFNSRIWEASLKAEVYPVMIFDDDIEIQKINPYLSFGLGVFHFNPTTLLNGQKVFLQPLHTEGEGFPGMNINKYPDGATTSVPFPKNYHLLQLYIPIKLGVKIYFNDTYALSGGVTFRHTFTDYIDDVSGYYVNPNLFDKYLSPALAAEAKQLYQRSLTPWKVRPGVLRGDPTANDSYTDVFLTLSIRLHKSAGFYTRRQVSCSKLP